MPRLIRAAAAALALLPSAAAAAEPPVVVASIPPVHALAASVMEGVGRPTLLVPPGVSPHVLALRPSQARVLGDADLVLWIGPALEAWLGRAIDTLAPAAAAVALADAEGVSEAYSPARPHRHEEGEEEGHGHADGGPGEGLVPDPHIWLSSANAVAMTAAIEDALAEADPGNEARYRENGRALRERLRLLGAELREALAPFREGPYVVFHDAYRHFAADMGLAPPVAVLTVNPGRAPGAERLRDVRRAIGESGARCVFVEPQFSRRLGETAAEGTGARVTTIDPLGMARDPGPGFYSELLRNAARSFRECLG